MGHHAAVGDVLPPELDCLNHIEVVQNVVECAVVWQALEELADGFLDFQRCLLRGESRPVYTPPRTRLQEGSGLTP